ncbi:MAG: tRNA (adenosine(37)-N6)-dimethylallyltransferase MiaA [Candidatus Peregrinibacteria bacterium]
MKLSGLPDIAGFLESAQRPLLVLVGQTASGKTSCSLEVAALLQEQGRQVEIVNADSRQLYRGLDIGTAKIRSEEMRGIPHHLLDVKDPKEEVTAAWYKREAQQVIDSIHERGNIPFLVGGSMLYVSAIIDNLSFVQVPDPALRTQLHTDLKREGPTALYERLQELDPEGALSVDPSNTVYLLRALEVCLSTGMSLQDAKGTKPSPYALLLLGMTCPVEELHRRIGERMQQMFASGWVEEVAGLLQRGYAIDDPGMQSHGYREIAQRLGHDAMETVRQDQELQDTITAKTRQYAKRQRTWWRNDSRIHWISGNEVACPERI